MSTIQSGAKDQQQQTEPDVQDVHDRSPATTTQHRTTTHHRFCIACAVIMFLATAIGVFVVGVLVQVLWLR